MPNRQSRESAGLTHPLMDLSISILGRLIGPFIRPSVMRRASCMGSQKWQVLPFIPPLTSPPPPTLTSPHFSTFNSHFSPLNFHLSPLTFTSLFTPTLTFPSLFTLQLSLSPLTLHPFNSHFLPFNFHFTFSLFTPPVSLFPLNFHLQLSLSLSIFSLELFLSLTFHPFPPTFPSHFSPLNSYFALSLFTP